MMNHVASSDCASTRRVGSSPALCYPAAGLVGCLCVAILTAFSHSAAAQYQTAPSESVYTPAAKPRELVEIRIDNDSGWSLGLDGYVGLSTLTNSERTKGHALAGGVSRLRFSFVQFGATLEVSDLVDEQWRSLGGFVGAFVPFTNWIDVDASIGIASRNWISKDTRYGTGGTSLRVPALNFRLGVSDRMMGGLLGPRMGAALLVGLDLDRRDVPWSYQITRSDSVSGVTQFGGITVALVATIGFDVNKRSKPLPRTISD